MKIIAKAGTDSLVIMSRAERRLFFDNGEIDTLSDPVKVTRVTERYEQIEAGAVELQARADQVSADLAAFIPTP